MAQISVTIMKNTIIETVVGLRQKASNIVLRGRDCENAGHQGNREAKG